MQSCIQSRTRIIHVNVRELLRCLLCQRNQVMILIRPCCHAEALKLPALLLDQVQRSALLDQLSLVHHKDLAAWHDGLEIEEWSVHQTRPQSEPALTRRR